MQPVVSVCLPARNAAKYIGETLDSIRVQTFKDWELIIVENCSTDGTSDVIEAWLAKHGDARMQLHRNATSLGMAENWNRAAQLARGSLLKVVCADDLLLPGCLQAQVAMMTANPRLALVACARQIINSQGRPLFVRRGFPNATPCPGGDVIRKALRAGANLIGDPVAVLMRTENFARVGGFSPEIVYYTDLELWVRILELGDFQFLPEALCSYRIHAQATTGSLRAKMHEDYFRMVARATARGSFKLSRLQRLALSARVRLMNTLRAAIYRWSGT